MKKIFTLLLCYLQISSGAQDFSGTWDGILTQKNKSESYYYQITITQVGQSISGTSFSSSPDEKNKGGFVLTGIWDGKQLVLQEVEQTQPEAGGWCLKYMLLEFSEKDGKQRLEGEWKADGCTPGAIILERKIGNLKTSIAKEEAHFSFAGRWTGHLSQSDRDYGFFYELTLETNGGGQSYIVSEDNGGSAFHQLGWAFQLSDSLFTLNETMVVSKTDPKWKWCIKSARLRLRKTPNSYVLEGTWEGYLEGLDAKTGKCAPGKVYLEKLIDTQVIETTIAEGTKVPEYTEVVKREVKVARIVEVQSPNVRIKVWDNGSVDGDIASLFLNGKQILSKHRVGKLKHGIPVKLQAVDNFLILHAESLGDIPPNTVAVSVDDGKKEQVIILVSNLQTSGAILIRQFKVE